MRPQEIHDALVELTGAMRELAPLEYASELRGIARDLEGKEPVIGTIGELIEAVELAHDAVASEDENAWSDLSDIERTEKVRAVAEAVGSTVHQQARIMALLGERPGFVRHPLALAHDDPSLLEA